MPKPPRQTTPIFPCLYPNVQDPAENYNKDGEEYRLKLVVPADHEWVEKMTERWTYAAEELLEERMAEAKPQKKGLLKQCKFRSPFIEQYNEDGDPSDEVHINFKRDARFENPRNGKTVEVKIPVFDSKGNVIKQNLNIGNGSLVVVSFSERPYVSEGNKQFGVSIRLEAVKLVKLEEYAGGDNFDDFGFDADEDGEGFTVDPNQPDDEEAFVADSTDEDAGDGDY
jgi:hypothetical protein